ncbi:hypothetical protein HanIR_Chr05g0218211 [Helianthus annuus]|nr:hypothetical protein HanIR_Chr05g0218211 [Helianthus annuus]
MTSIRTLELSIYHDLCFSLSTNLSANDWEISIVCVRGLFRLSYLGGHPPIPLEDTVFQLYTLPLFKRRVI